MSEIKLLPCPFCGGGAQFMKSSMVRDLVTAECSRCRVNKHYFATKTEAAEVWNTRADSAEINRLKNELSDFICEAMESVSRNMPNCGIHSTPSKNPLNPLTESLRSLGWSTADIKNKLAELWSKRND